MSCHVRVDNILQGGDCIASKNIGQVLRILGQNPTEDEIVEMVMKVRLKIVILLLSSLPAGKL